MPDTQTQGAQKLRTEHRGYVPEARKDRNVSPERPVTKLVAQRSRRRPRESVGWTFFNSLSGGTGQGQYSHISSTLIHEDSGTFV
ncbi:MAG: hypothetical protein CSYNP_00176 [Syntrophus sp. SKADARSKE-3]|nr:hypothetical protein [Syntrophus sp. SKADARSKE-3]